jgi:hypothetical protein
VKEEASAGKTPAGNSSATAQDFLRKFAGRQISLDGPDWEVFSSKKYPNDTTPATGGLDGATRSSKSGLHLQRSRRADEPKRKSA